MTGRTIKIVKTPTGWGFQNSVVPGSPDNLDLYTILFNISELKDNRGRDVSLHSLRKFAKRYKTKVVVMPA